MAANYDGFMVMASVTSPSPSSSSSPPVTVDSVPCQKRPYSFNPPLPARKVPRALKQNHYDGIQIGGMKSQLYSSGVVEVPFGSAIMPQISGGCHKTWALEVAGGGKHGAGDFMSLQARAVCYPSSTNEDCYTCILTFFTTFSGFRIFNLQLTVGTYTSESQAMTHTRELFEQVAKAVRNHYREVDLVKVTTYANVDRFDLRTHNFPSADDEDESPFILGEISTYDAIVEFYCAELHTREHTAEAEMRSKMLIDGKVPRVTANRLNGYGRSGVYIQADGSVVLVMPRGLIPSATLDENDMSDLVPLWQGVPSPTAFELGCTLYNAMLSVHPAGSTVPKYDLRNLVSLQKLDDCSRAQICLACSHKLDDSDCVQCASAYCYGSYHRICLPANAKEPRTNVRWLCPDCEMVDTFERLMAWSTNPPEALTFVRDAIPRHNLAASLYKTFIRTEIENVRPTFTEGLKIRFREGDEDWVRVSVTLQEVVGVSNADHQCVTDQNTEFGCAAAWNATERQFKGTIHVSLRDEENGEDVDVDGSKWTRSLPVYLFKL